MTPVQSLAALAGILGCVALVAAGERTSLPPEPIEVPVQYPTVTMPAPSSHRVGHYLIAQAVLKDCATCTPRYGREVTFTSSNPAVVKFIATRNWDGTPAGNTTLFQAVSPGVVTLTGATQSNTRGTTTITVYDPTAKITLTPSAIAGPISDTVRLHAAGFDSTGKPLWNTP